MAFAVLWFELYFTDPTNPAAKQESGGPDGPLVASLDSARVAIDMAAYSLNLKDVEVFALTRSTARRTSAPRHGKR